MNRKSRLLSMLLCLVMILSLVSGCSSKKEEAPAASEEVNNTPVKILCEITGGKDPEEHDLWVKEASKLSGVNVDITKVSGKDYPTKLTATLASGDDTDIVYMLAADFEKLFKLGLFEPLTDQIKNSSVLSDPENIDPKEWDRIRRDDGEIYAVFNKYEGGRLPLVRWDWMKKLGLEEPKTLDEYYEVLKAFTKNDPDGNGADDTYGLTLKGIYDIQPFMSAYGLTDGYTMDSEGKWYMPYATKDAAKVYDWLAKMYKEGIIDPNFTTNSSSNCRELILSGKAGAMVYWDNWVGLFNEKAQAAGTDTAFEIRGLKPAMDQSGNGWITAGEDGLWVVLKSSKNKDNAFKFLEFMHTNEGSILNILGVEGHDYEVKDGKYTLTQIGQEHAMDHGMVVPKSLKWENPVKTAKNFAEAQEIVKAYAKPEFLREQSKDAKEIVTKYAVKSIMGEISGDEAVAKMQEELKSKKYID